VLKVSQDLHDLPGVLRAKLAFQQLADLVTEQLVERLLASVRAEQQ
jgi:hypothetical protein